LARQDVKSSPFQEAATVTGTLYEIHVVGPLPDTLLEELGRLRVQAEETRTVLRGPVRDQAALLGVLLRLQKVGIELVEVRQFSDPPLGHP
jgi:hypothetical protein